MKKSVLGIGGLVVLLGLGWAAGSYYVGNRAKADIEVLINQPKIQTAMRFSDWKHQQGPFYSSGTFIMHYPDPDAVTQPRPDLFALLVRYDIDHRLLPARLSDFKWSAEPVGKSEQQMTSLFGVKPVIAGQGSLGWDASARSTYQFPPLAAKRGDNELAMAPMGGDIKLQGLTMQFSLKLPSVQIASDGKKTRLTDIAMNVDLSDRFKGLGSSVFSVGQAQLDGGSLQGFAMRGQSRQTGDRMTFELRNSIKSLKIASESVSDAILDLQLADFDAQSVTTLSTVLDQAGNLDNLTAAQQKEVQEAIRTIIVKGFSVGIPQLSAISGKAKATGQAKLVVKPSASDQPASFDAAKQLSSSGEVNLTGDLPPNLTAAGVMLGALVQSADGFRASYKLEGGTLMVNGRPVPIADQLRQINAGVAMFLR